MCSVWLRRGLNKRPPSSSPKPSGGPACARRCDHVQHLVQDAVISGRDFNIVGRSEGSRMQKEVERVDVVVERLLEVNPVGANLASGFAQRLFSIHPSSSVRRAAFAGRVCR